MKYNQINYKKQVRCHFGIPILNFKNLLHPIIVFLLLTLNKYLLAAGWNDFFLVIINVR